MFINALRDSHKISKSVFNRENVDKFLELWAEYDPDSSEFIYVDQLIFLLFELPIPFGQGGVIPQYKKIYGFERFYDKRLKENELIMRAKYNHGDATTRKDKIKWLKFHHDLYLLNEHKGIIIKETRTPMMLKNHDIPVYKGGKVNFRDVLYQIIKNAFDSTEEQYLPNQKVVATFRTRWKRLINSKKNSKS